MAVKRVTIVIIFFFSSRRWYYFDVEDSFSSVCDFGRQIMTVKGEVIFLRKEGSFVHLSSVLKIHCLTHVRAEYVRANWRRKSNIISYYFVIYSLKANMSFSQEKLERDNLIFYRTIYLTYQHMLQIACKLDVPNLHQFEIVTNKRWLSLFEDRGIRVLHFFS